MRHRTAPLALFLLPLILGACSEPTPSTEVIEIDCERFSAEQGDQIKITRGMTVSQGSTIVLRLCANPSTGFEWEDAVISAPMVLTEQSREFFPPAVPMPGSAGLEQWTFTAADKGDCTVSLCYSRPWDGGEKGAWLFDLKVTVR